MAPENCSPLPVPPVGQFTLTAISAPEIQVFTPLRIPDVSHGVHLPPVRGSGAVGPGQDPHLQYLFSCFHLFINLCAMNGFFLEDSGFEHSREAGEGRWDIFFSPVCESSLTLLSLKAQIILIS